jgi:hypothetical protein
MIINLSQQFPHVSAFLEAIEPLLPAYRHGLLSYVAVVEGDEAVILRAAIRFSVDDAAPRRINQPTSIRVGQIRFDKLDMNRDSIEAWISEVVSGNYLPCHDPLLKLLPEITRRYSAYHESTPPSFSRAMKDLECLQISGVGREFIGQRQKALDRELHEIGFDSFEQLMRTFELKPSNDTLFEISVSPVARIDSTSTLQGTTLQLIVHLAQGLEREKLRITVCDADLSNAPLPHSYKGSELDWTNEREGYWIGTLTYELSRSAVMTCRAVYAGRIQHEVRLADPHTLPNPRRMLMQVIDADLQRLRKLLTSPTEKQRDDFETAVGLLLQMLGFAPAAFGRLSGLPGLPDLFVEGTDGEMLVVEATTDVPDDDKLMKLVSRVARSRDDLVRALGASAPTVTAMMICPLPTAELQPIRAKAEKFGVMILCRPEIESAIARSEFSPDAGKVLRDWRNQSLIDLVTRGLDGRQ